MFMGVSVPLPPPMSKGIVVDIPRIPSKLTKIRNIHPCKENVVKLWNFHISYYFTGGYSEIPRVDDAPHGCWQLKRPPDHRHGHACPGPAVPHGGATPAPRPHGVRHSLGRGHGGGGAARGALCRVEQGASKCRRWDGEGLKDVEEGLENRGFPWFSHGFPLVFVECGIPKSP